MSVKEIRNTLMKKCNLHKTHNIVWIAKRVISDKLREKHEEEFAGKVHRSD